MALTPNAPWARKLAQEQPERAQLLSNALAAYDVLPVANRATYQEQAQQLAQEYGVPLTGEALRKLLRRSKPQPPAQSQAGPQEPQTPESLPGRDLAHENEQLRQANRRLADRLRSHRDRAADLVLATYDGARDAMLTLGPVPPVEPPALAHPTHSAEVALWHLTDWQGSKVTASYSSEVMRERVLRFCYKAHKITEIQRADHAVSQCVIAFGGDMVEGLFNFPTQPFEIDATLFGQFVTVSRLMVDAVRYALHIYDAVEVVTEWGNHGRIGSKRNAVPRADNLDRMTYELARQLLSHEPRLTWQDCPEDIQRIEIGNYRALLMHGDEVGRNGFASPMQIVRHANQWRSGAYPWDFRDIYCGHYHTHAEFPMANGAGAVYQTGSTESDNRYARELMAASAVPSQRLHFIDPERGRVSAQYKIYLDAD